MDSGLMKKTVWNRISSGFVVLSLLSNFCFSGSAWAIDAYGTTSATLIPAYSSPTQQIGYQETLNLLNGATGTSTGKTYYLSSTGSDKNNGLAQTSAFGSLQYAVSQLQAGDTLFIAEGNYQQSANLSRSGTASAPITIKGVGNVVFDGTNLDYYDPIFDVTGQSYIQFDNLTVNNARAAVQITSGSHINISNIRTDKTQFAVWMHDASYINITNAYVTNARNSFRGEGVSHDISFNYIEMYGSKDIYPGYDTTYTNGDGIIFEVGSYNVSIKNSVSGNMWDAGFDIKADNVTLENVVSFGNKNGMKLWGNNIVVKNALVFGNLTQADSGADGYGINLRTGSTTIVDSTIADNQANDVKSSSGTTLTMVNDIVARRDSVNRLIYVGGNASFSNVLFDHAGVSSRESWVPSSGTLWGDPGFVDWAGGNYRLKSGSMAINKGVVSSLVPATDLDQNARVYGTAVDLGAFEYQPVASPNQPPVLTVPAAQSTAEGSPISFTVNATDPDGNPLTYAALNLPSGAAFDTKTRTFTWTPNYSQEGQYTLLFSVNDGMVTVQQSVLLTVLHTNQLPVFQSMGNQTAKAGDPVLFTVNANDPDGDTLTYSVLNLPQGAVFDPQTRVFIWNPSATQTGTYGVTFRVSDGVAAVDKTVQIVLQDAAPVISPLAPVTGVTAVSLQSVNTQDYSASSGGVTDYKSDQIVMYTNQSVDYVLNADQNAQYLFDVYTAQVSRSDPPPNYQFHLIVSVDGKAIGSFDAADLRTYTKTAQMSLGTLAAGAHTVRLEWVNDTYVDLGKTAQDSNLGLKSLSFYRVPAPQPPALTQTISAQSFTASTGSVSLWDSQSAYLYNAQTLTYGLNTAKSGDYFLSLSTAQFSNNAVPPGYQFQVNIYVDGQFLGTYSLSATTQLTDSQLISLGALSAGAHSLQVEWTNDVYTAGLYDTNLKIGGLKILS